MRRKSSSRAPQTAQPPPPDSGTSRLLSTFSIQHSTATSFARFTPASSSQRLRARAPFGDAEVNVHTSAVCLLRAALSFEMHTLRQGDIRTGTPALRQSKLPSKVGVKPAPIASRRVHGVSGPPHPNHVDFLFHRAALARDCLRGAGTVASCACASCVQCTEGARNPPGIFAGFWGGQVSVHAQEPDVLHGWVPLPLISPALPGVRYLISSPFPLGMFVNQCAALSQAWAHIHIHTPKPQNPKR